MSQDPAQLLTLARALKAEGRTDDAIAAYKSALELDALNAPAWNNLGNLLHRQRKLPDAIKAYQSAIALKPDYAMAYNNLAIVLREDGQHHAALAHARAAAQLQPTSLNILLALATTLRDAGQTSEAIATAQSALALTPDSARLYNTLGVALTDARLLDRAAAALRRAVQLWPDYAEAWTNLATTLREQGQLDDAMAALDRASAASPLSPQTHIARAVILKDMGALDASLASYEMALAIDHSLQTAISGRLYTLHFHAASTPQSLLSEHRNWGDRLAPLAPTNAFSFRPAHGRLRIGYVSPDFKDHVISRFLLPLLAHHDHSKFDIYCYSSLFNPDAITAQYRCYGDHWHEVAGYSDRQLADLIRSDEIDILIDLSLHMAGTRLRAFAFKPALIQIAYLAYCSTSGLAAIDYRFTDPYFDPPGTDANYTESSLRLDSYWCYQPSPHASDPGPLPALANGFITFGCLNNFAKVSPDALATWSRILQAVPDSRLLLHCRPGSHRAAVLEALTQGTSIAPDRIQLIDYLPTADYFKLYNQIDIALDPFPYGGGTTTFDALWMGTPVITLAGQTAVGRGGVSILSHLGQPDWIADSTVGYSARARALASDIMTLAKLRTSLRQRLQSSILTNAPAFARNVESHYLQLTGRV